MFDTWIATLGQPSHSARQLILVWLDRIAKRRRLSAMSERELKDIRLSRIDASQECRKPFWRL